MDEIRLIQSHCVIQREGANTSECAESRYYKCYN